MIVIRVFGVLLFILQDSIQNEVIALIYIKLKVSDLRVLLGNYAHKISEIGRKKTKILVHHSCTKMTTFV